MRGVVFEPALQRLTQQAEDRFGFAEMMVVSFNELFAGKLNAALDRQHPRDLFDVKILYENEGITDELFRTFLVYLAGSNRPPHELLDPNRIDISQVFQKGFVGMMTDTIDQEELEETRERLVSDIQSRLSGVNADFLRLLQMGEPNFDMIGLPQAANLPAVLWKQQNIKKFMMNNPERHREQSEALEALLA